MGVVETTHGRRAGRETPPPHTSLAIPFAAAPVGRLRFAPPAPVAPWSGVRPALVAASSCPQQRHLLPGMDPGPTGEDCLALNVFTPGADDARRPVMVWFHGGGFTTG